ncbi:MAG: histidine kinase [Bacteroidales bacterium]|nr:histidine kinase [Bacteroidales bacterium]
MSKGDGLETSSVNCIVRDKEGFVWLGTNKGLYRFDGTNFIHLNHIPNDSTTISGNEIISLFVSREGDIYASTNEYGVNIINQKTLDVKHLSPGENDPVKLTSAQNKVIYDDHNNIWITSSYRGVDVFEKESGKKINFKPSDYVDGVNPRLSNTITCGENDPENPDIYWLGTLQGIFRFDIAQNKMVYFPLDEWKAENPDMYGGREEIVRDLLFTSSKELWFASWGGGIGRLNTQTGTYKILKYQPLHPVNGFRNNVIRLKQKNDRELWFAAQHDSFGVCDIKTGEINFLTNPLTNKTSINNPSDIVYTDDGLLFVSSYSDGLFYTQTHANFFNHQFVPFNLICASSEKDGTFFCGTHGRRGQLLQINSQSNSYSSFKYMPIDDLDDNFFVNIFNMDDKAWLIESFDIYYFDKKKKEIFPYLNFRLADIAHVKDPHHFIRSAAMDLSGRLWLGSTFNGIFMVDPINDSVKNFFNEDKQFNNPYFDEFIFSMFTDSKGRIWYGSQYFGYFDPLINKFINLNETDIYNNSDIFLNNIFAFTETEKNNIWIGTESSGIAVIEIKNDSAFFVRSYTLANGLADNQISDMVTDQNNNVWVITSAGLSRIITKTGEIENYNQQYGLQSLFFLRVLENGEIVAGGRNGYYHFYPDSVHPVQNTTNLYITSFKIFDEKVPVDKNISTQQALNLNYDQNFFSIEFGMINFFKDKPSDFYYMLEGLDDKWLHAGDRTYISYTNLKGGKYKLHIKSNNTEKLILPLHIETPYWKTWWFFSLCILLAIGLLLMGHLYRLRQIKKQEHIKSDFNKKINQLEMKALRAQMNPHFLFNSLNSIRYYILKNDNDNAAEYITKFSKLLRLILSNSRQNQISLKDELHTLEIYIDFEQMRFNNKFSYEILIEPEIKSEEIQIQPLTIQPFVENAIWHGLMPKKDKGHLEISVSADGKRTKIIVKDNGVGRKNADDIDKSGLRETKSFGLKITEERMNLMESIHGKKADFKIVDLFDNKQAAGTKVIITIEA